MKRCGNCMYGVPQEYLDGDDKRIFTLIMYAKGIDYEEWDNWVLCVRSPIYTVRRKDDVCEEWKPAKRGNK